MPETRDALAERFEKFVHRPPFHPCWEWTGAKQNFGRRAGVGYGVLNVGGRVVRAHRIAYELYVGSIGDLCVLHTCDNPGCVRPEHLFLGTKKDNTQDMVKKGRARGKVSFGESHGCSKLTVAQVRRIRELWETGNYLQKELGPMFGVTPTMIGYIVRGVSWGPQSMESRNENV